ncbi:MAG: hypothetical protein ACTHMI_08265 [Mucilaginibacter sp.]
MAGNSTGANNYLTNATIWKNGKPTILTNGLPDSRSIASAIAIKDNDIYIVGSTYSGNTKVACYWKNGVFVKLSNGTDTYVSAITIIGNDIYMAGSSVDKDGNQVATYWKNDVPTAYPRFPAGARFEVTGIAVSGNDVYLSGGLTGPQYSDGTIPITVKSPLLAGYLKNGVFTGLAADDGFLSEANCIVVDGGNIYLAGNHNGDAIFWQNGTTQNLTNNEGASDARAIALYNGSVNISGYKNNKPVFWKDGTLTQLKNGNEYLPGGIANAIAVNGTGVYIASGINSAATYSTFWFNGNQVDAIEGIDVVNGIVVIPRN